MKDDRLLQCPACGKDGLKRHIGLGAGIIFKGSGFYETDYKRNRSGSSSGSGNKAPGKSGKPTTSGGDEKKSSSGTSSSDGKSDT